MLIPITTRVRSDGFAGYRGNPEDPTAILLRHNGLHIELVIDRSHPIGGGDPAGIADIILESALTTICDLADSVAAVDPDDQVSASSNWLGQMQGTLVATFEQTAQQLRVWKESVITGRTR